MKFVKFFNQVGIEDIPLVGGKNASLGEMIRELGNKGIRVPNGFAITAQGYWHLLRTSGTEARLHEIMDNLEHDNVLALQEAGAAAREAVFKAPLPEDLTLEILTAYSQLKQEYGHELTLAVRSSATAEDLPTASFAGQQETFLNVSGEEHLLQAIKACFASLFTDRAIHYRNDQGFDHFDVGLSVGVMKMVRSDLASSGVMFSVDTESGHPDVVFITGAFGLGETVVQGAVDPDEWYVHKPTLAQGYKRVLRRHLGKKLIKMVYDNQGSKPVKTIPTPLADQTSYALNDQEVIRLAEMAVTIEKHYSQKAGVHRPMDMEWAKDGIDGQLYIVQARPETVASQKSTLELVHYELQGQGKILAEGRAVGERIAQGKISVIRTLDEMDSFQDGQILVSDTTTPDWEPIMKRASAIVTNRGGRTCHAAIIARELGIPAVVGCQNATKTLKDDQIVTVSCAEGDTGRIYEGEIPFEIQRHKLDELSKPPVNMMVNLANPETAFKTALMPCDGVGLARMEFIINNHIGIHPMALLKPHKIKDSKLRDLINYRTRHDSTPADFYIRKLSEGVATLTAAFYPRPVVMRLSDFKSNEYASLMGGKYFEPEEENPMIGFRGAARYTHPKFEPAFALECEALRQVRDEFGLTNMRIMVPFCRRIDEAKRVIETLAKYGLERGKNGLEIYMMCEIPNNVILIDQFAQYFDGFSIGSNDLTQLTLGVDRDSETVAFDYEERDEGVKTLVRWAVEGAKRNDCHSGFCGQAPSDYPEYAQFLMDLGIDSMSLNPDSLMKTLVELSKIAKQNQKPQ